MLVERLPSHPTLSGEEKGGNVHLSFYNSIELVIITLFAPLSSSLGCGIGYGYLHRIPVRGQNGTTTVVKETVLQKPPAAIDPNLLEPLVPDIPAMLDPTNPTTVTFKVAPLFRCKTRHVVTGIKYFSRRYLIRVNSTLGWFHPAQRHRLQFLLCLHRLLRIFRACPLYRL